MTENTDNIFRIPIGALTQRQFVGLMMKTANQSNFQIQSATENSMQAAYFSADGNGAEYLTLSFEEEEAIVVYEIESAQFDYAPHLQFSEFESQIKHNAETTEPEMLDAIWQSVIDELNARDEVNMPDEVSMGWRVLLPHKGFEITPVLMFLNVLVFIIMLISGVHIISPSTVDLVKWGATFRPLVLDGQPWRLLTSTFLHAGILHLAMNMYAFFYIGILLEKIIPRWKYLTAYLVCGVVASAASVAMHDNTVGVGASGAIFGMYGLFLALLTSKLIAPQDRKSLLSSIGIFILFNLLFGLKDGIDNAAHIGGLVCGFVLGYALLPELTNHLNQTLKKYAFPAGIIGVMGISALYLFSMPNNAPIINQKMTEFAKYETEALKLYEIANQSNPEQIRKFIEKTGIPSWEKCAKILEDIHHLKLSNNEVKRNRALMQYVYLRQTNYAIIYQSADNLSDSVMNEINSNDQQITRIIQQLTGAKPGKKNNKE